MLSLVTLLAPLVFGVYWKRATGVGAMISIVAGFAAWVVFEFMIPIGVHSLIPATALSVAALVIGSLLWKQSVSAQ